MTPSSISSISFFERFAMKEFAITKYALPADSRFLQFGYVVGNIDVSRDPDTRECTLQLFSASEPDTLVAVLTMMGIDTSEFDTITSRAFGDTTKLFDYLEILGNETYRLCFVYEFAHRFVEFKAKNVKVSGIHISQFPEADRDVERDYQSSVTWAASFCEMITEWPENWYTRPVINCGRWTWSYDKASNHAYPHVDQEMMLVRTFLDESQIQFCLTRDMWEEARKHYLNYQKTLALPRYPIRGFSYAERHRFLGHYNELDIYVVGDNDVLVAVVDDDMMAMNIKLTSMESLPSPSFRLEWYQEGIRRLMAIDANFRTWHWATH